MNKKYYLPEKSVEVTAKNFHVRYADGNCSEWTVIVNGKMTGDIYYTNSHFCGLWKNDKQIMGTCDADFSVSTNYRRKQIRALMLNLLVSIALQRKSH